MCANMPNGRGQGKKLSHTLPHNNIQLFIDNAKKKDF